MTSSRATGTDGIKVNPLEDFGPSVEKTTDAQMNAGITTIVEIICTRELGDPFRRDALRVPIRHLDKYKKFL